MKRLLLISLALAISGCCSKSFSLDLRFAPLQNICEDRAKVLGPGVLTTIGDACYTDDLDALLATHPNGSVQLEALLLHEQAHARRQAPDLATWLVKYEADAGFRWQEEQVGWAIEIGWLVKHSSYVNVEAMAAFLSSKVYGMVSLEDAKAFVLKAIQDAEK